MAARERTAEELVRDTAVLAVRTGETPVHMETKIAGLEHVVLDQLDALAERLRFTMLRDRERLRARLNAIHRRTLANQPFDQLLEKLAAEFDEASSLVTERQSHLPKPAFDESLPIVQKRQEIAEAIRDNQVVVICGETGSGKTTQLPKICLELGRGIAGMIGHTQPRRIAARSVATRIAQELNTPLGEVVGYQVRFTDKRSPRTLVKLMTDGILLAETQNDRLLLDYDTIIIDEAHERSLNIDFLLGYLKQLQPNRPDLKVIVTSATIDPQRFSQHFNNAPIVMVSGRTYPVEVRYRPLQQDDPDEEDLLMEDAVVAATDELWQTAGPGDTLVFCSGEREIRELAELLRKHHPPATEILPLFARLSGDEQMKVFSPHQKRRIILATNVAETSLTVPGIRYVIDTGLARMSRYAPKTKVQRLPIEPISRASADQRKGRCGRVAEGICVRLYSQEDFERRAEFTEPQILRTNLAAVILQMKALRLGDIGEFPFIDPPDSRAIRDGYHTLTELGAIDHRNELTELGRLLAKLPIDPRVGRMVLAARDEAVVVDVLIIAAALSVQDPRERPSDKQQAADAAHGKFRDEQSDFISFIKLWDWFHESKKHLSGSQLRKACRDNFLSFIRLREWQDIHSQLNEIVSEMGFTKSSPPMQRNDAIHRALLAGLLGNIGLKSESFEYTGARNTKFHIFPGSTLFSRKPPWIMAAEIVETTKLYARTNASIKPEWIERAAEHLLKKSYTDPHWQAHTGHVMAYEKVTLYGLPIVPRRSVHYGPIDPKQSRQLFIQHALVDGDWFTDARFARHNRELIEQVQMIESKARKRDLLVDVQAQFDFYDKRVPATVYNAPLFEKWRRQAESQAKDILFMKPADLMNYDAEIGFEQFPDTLAVNGMVLPLTYHLDPGAPDDGVTVALPLAALNQFSPPPFEWLVPGLLKEKVIALVRSLPKQLRTQFVPVPEFAAAALQPLRLKTGSLLDALAQHLSNVSKQSITRYDFQLDTLPDHLRMNFRVVDERGKIIAAGRDLLELQQRVGGKATAIFTDNAEKEFHRDGITSWDFGRLPEQIELHRHGMTLQAFPAIVDQQTSVGLRLLDTRAAADIATRGGVRRLFLLQLDRQVSTLMRQIPIDDLCLAFARLGNSETLRNNLILSAADAVLSDPTTVRSREDFISRADAAWRDLPAKLDQFVAAARETLREWQELELQLEAPPPPLLVPPINDIRRQIAALVHRDFLLSTPPAWLPHQPRFLRGVNIRLKKLFNAGFSRDLANAEQLAPILDRYVSLKSEHARRGLVDPHLTQLRWMLEEFRISLFAQELKTSIPISAQRLNRQIDLVVP